MCCSPQSILQCEAASMGLSLLCLPWTQRKVIKFDISSRHWVAELTVEQYQIWIVIVDYTNERSVLSRYLSNRALKVEIEAVRSRKMRTEHNDVPAKPLRAHESRRNSFLQFVPEGLFGPWIMANSSAVGTKLILRVPLQHVQCAAMIPATLHQDCQGCGYQRPFPNKSANLRLARYAQMQNEHLQMIHFQWLPQWQSLLY